jgi:TPR repeat protein
MAQPSHLNALDWLRHCAEESGVGEGDSSMVFLSYAGADHRYVKLLRKNLDRPLANLSRNGEAFSVWEYADAQAGTKPGEAFRATIAENMWRARAAFVFWSQDYVASDDCYVFELPFLLWRLKYSNFKVFVIRVNATSVDDVPIAPPPYLGVQGVVDLQQIIDDRNPNLMPLGEPNARLLLAPLVQKDEALAQQRLARYVGAVCELLSRQEGVERAGHGPARASEPARTVVHVEKPSPPVARGWKVPAALALAVGLGAAAYVAVSAWRGAAPSKEALALCDDAAMSPDDPARQGHAGVAFDRLDPARIPVCEQAVALAPTTARYRRQLGRLLESAGRRDEAIASYKRAFDDGDRGAANNLGILYEYSPDAFLRRGDDLACSTRQACDEQALTWFAKSQEGASSSALYNMALMYRDRRGVLDRHDALACGSPAECDSRARDLFVRAASKGNTQAPLELGLLYAKWGLLLAGPTPASNVGAPCASKSDCAASAQALLFPAANAGDADAQFALGGLYERYIGFFGEGPPNGCADARACDRLAMQWYAKAAPRKPAAADGLKRLTAASPPE